MVDSKDDGLIPIPETYSRRRLNALYRKISLPNAAENWLKHPCLCGNGKKYKKCCGR